MDIAILQTQWTGFQDNQPFLVSKFNLSAPEFVRQALHGRLRNYENRAELHWNGNSCKIVKSERPYEIDLHLLISWIDENFGDVHDMAISPDAGYREYLFRRRPGSHEVTPNGTR